MWLDSLPPPGTLPFLPSLLSLVQHPFPLEPVIVHVLLLAILAGDRNVIFRTRDEDVVLVAKLATLVLNTLFGYNVHRVRCHPNCAHQSPSEFISSLFLPRRSSASKLSIAPSVSVGSTRRTSLSHPSESLPDYADPDPLPNLASHFRNTSRGSTDALKLPSVLVVSGLELATLASQKAVLQTLAERKVVLSGGGISGHDYDSLTLPNGFFMVYVCRADPWERPSIYKSLLDRFAMSSSVDIATQTRLAIRQYRPPSSPSTNSSAAALPTLHSLSSFSGSQPLSSPVFPFAVIQQLKHLCATRVHIRPHLSIYLADLFSAARYHGSLDGMMLTVRARQDAEALVRANRVLGADRTGAELIEAYAERSRETNSVSAGSYSHPSIDSVSDRDGLLEGFNVPGTREPLDASSPQHSQTEQPMELDVSEADIARMFPRVVSHRIRVRGSPFDEILSSAVCGAVSPPGHDSYPDEGVQWQRETVKDILVHILAVV